MNLMTEPMRMTYWHEGAECCDSEWEAAYARFETPEQEIAKFLKRFRRMGVHHWPKDLRIAEIFCGRGNGLVALERLGFTRLSGVDLAPSLLHQYQGAANLYVADCRDLRFASESLDAVFVQGGLHHLPDVERDLPRVLSEVQRVLRPDGRFFIVEPWLTPFLRMVHFLSEQEIVCRLSEKFRAFHEMTERERVTYEAWLARPRSILLMLRSYFATEQQSIRLGKLMVVGRKKIALEALRSAT